MKVETDPLVIEAARRTRPYLASEIRGDPMLARTWRRIFAAFDAFGWRNVFAVPIHGPSGYSGLVALATLRQFVMDGARNRGRFPGGPLV